MGLTGSCGGDEDAAARPYEVSFNGGVMTTQLDFAGGGNRRLDEVSALATFSTQLETVSLQFGAGSVLGGSLNGNGSAYRLNEGPSLFAAVGRTFYDGGPGRPYLAGSISLGFSTVSTYNEAVAGDRPQLTAFDLRASAVIGKQLFGFWLPYAGASLFGGPVFFNPNNAALLGTDAYHFRITVGSSFALPAHLRFFVEAGVLGEQSAVAGLGYRF